jgi:hypothetical protein
MPCCGAGLDRGGFQKAVGGGPTPACVTTTAPIKPEYDTTAPAPPIVTAGVTF